MPSRVSTKPYPPKTKAKKKETLAGQEKRDPADAPQETGDISEIQSRVTNGGDTSRWSPDVETWQTAHNLIFLILLPGVDIEKNVDVGITGVVLWITGQRNLRGGAGEEFTWSFPLPPTIDVNRSQASYKDGILKITFWNKDVSPFVPADRVSSENDHSQGHPVPILLDIVSPLKIEAPEAETYEPEMSQDDSIIFKGETLFKGGRPYRPLPLAAQLGQAPRQTLRNWIKNKTEFQGRPLQTYYLQSLDRYFVSEESIDRMANRFIKWRSGKPAGPAGPVTIGKTKDQSAFLSTSDAARILGVSPRTTWLWASQEGKAPTGKPLDVIKCTTSDHFYIHEKDVYELKKLIPRSGLQRGRRPQLAPQ